MHVSMPLLKIVRAFRIQGPAARRGLTVGILVGALIHLPAAPVLARGNVYYNTFATAQSSWLKARADSRDALAKAAQAVFGKKYASEAAFVAAYDKVVKQAEKAIAGLGTREYRGTVTYQAADGVEEAIDAGTGFRKTRPLKRMETVDIYWAPGWCVDVEARGAYDVYVLPADEELQNRVEAMYDLTKFELSSFKFVPDFNKSKVTATFMTLDLTKAGAKATAAKKVLDFDLEPATAAFTYPVPDPEVTVTKVTETPYPLYTTTNAFFTTTTKINPLGQWTVHYEVPPPAPFEEVKSAVQALHEKFGSESSTSRQVFNVPYGETGATTVVTSVTPSAPVAPTGGGGPSTVVEFVRVDYDAGPTGKMSGVVDRHEVKAVTSFAYATEEGEWTPVSAAPAGTMGGNPGRVITFSSGRPLFVPDASQSIRVDSFPQAVKGIGAHRSMVSKPGSVRRGVGNGGGAVVKQAVNHAEKAAKPFSKGGGKAGGGKKGGKS